MSKTIQNIIVFILFTIYSCGVFAETVISGSISGDAVWVKDSGGYIVDGVCIQDPKSTLKISPGVSIRFNTGSVLILNGLVNAEGSDVDPIIIKGAQDDRFKIQLNSAADNSVLSWIEIRGGGDGFEGALVIKTGSPKVMNIKIINAKAFGFYAEKCNSSIIPNHHIYR